MLSRLNIGDLKIDVEYKTVKNIHLSVYPPMGHVRIVAPSRIDLETVRVFAISKLPWIRKQQKKFQSQERISPREFLDRETHYLWGERLLLKIIEKEEGSKIDLKHRRLIMSVRPMMGKEAQKELIARWYRGKLKEEVARLLTKWEPILRVKVHQFFVRRMKTKWGSCNPLKRTIRLNTELAKKPKEYLEYVVVHEIVHLLESRHNQNFKQRMDNYLPNWKYIREQMKKTPIEQEGWD